MNETIRQGLTLAAVGLGIVFMVQLLIAGAITLARTLDEKWQAGEKEAKSATIAAAPTIDTTSLILIAAAATAVLQKKKFRILQVRRLRPAHRLHSPAWRQSGREAIHHSHKPRD